MCDPTGGWLIGLSVLSAGLGVAQSVTQMQQAQENVAWQNAQAEQGFQFQMMQASAQRNFEQMREDQQRSWMEANRIMAGNAYADEIAALNIRLMQEQEAVAQRKIETGKQGLQARGEVAAMGRIGNTSENLIADLYRQQAAFDFVTDRNLAFSTMQTQEEKRGSAARYASRLASQQPYIKQPVLDPLRPIPMAAPSATPYILGGLGAVVGGVQTGISAAGQIKAMKPSGLGTTSQNLNRYAPLTPYG